MRRAFCVTCCNFYGNTRVICDHLVIHVHKNKIFEERVVFLHLIDTDVRGTFLYIGYLRGFCGAHYSILVNFVSFFFLWL